MVRSSRPTNATSPTSTFKPIQLRESRGTPEPTTTFGLMIAKARLAALTERPSASGVFAGVSKSYGPFTPANARKPLAEIFSKDASTKLSLAPTRTEANVDLSNEKLVVA